MTPRDPQDPEAAARLVMGGDKPLDQAEEQAHDNRQMPDVSDGLRRLAYVAAACFVGALLWWAL